MTVLRLFVAHEAVREPLMQLPPDIVEVVREDFGGEGSLVLLDQLAALPHSDRIRRCIVVAANGRLDPDSAIDDALARQFVWGAGPVAIAHRPHTRTAAAARACPCAGHLGSCAVMRPRAFPLGPRTVALTLLLAAPAACGGSDGDAATSWRDRELAWRYGPTSGIATATHCAGAGARGKPIAAGWHVRVEGGKTLAVSPHELAASHALFGKVKLAVELYGRDSKLIETLVTPTITAGNASFTLDLSEATAQRTWDAVLWFRDA
ncbi:MAG TPA: hypothetical protein VFZ65_07915 [Planctomycetota bacterium]|nr:hypothetical protein [Planctomycetota bacterium]